ncbi:MAG: BACON domain-containing protein, partial [Bacteroidales bacterium]|nr:BACON domain-containing protein [Bacteroidales bacterium]
MKIRNFVVSALAAAVALVSCKPQEENLGMPSIKIGESAVEFTSEGGEKQLTITATRDWMADWDADWLVVSPESGSASADAQTVTVTALSNTGMDRSADVKFTIGMASKTLKVTQAGPGGSAEALIVYYNDYDKEEAEKTYGSGSSWPYLDQFDGWMNETGTGAENVEYAFSGMSARSNSTSDSDYSDYAGSGKNNMFFGKSAYLATKNIALGGATDFTLTFGTEKYSQDNGSVFTKSEFHIFVSNDAAKWVEITDYSFAGEGTEGRWNIATADFSVPAGTENLS